MRLASTLLMMLVLNSARISAQVQTQWEADVPMLDCEGTPCIDASANGRTLRLAIDTGDDRSLIDAKLADTASVRPDKPRTNQNSPYRGTADGISVGEAEFKNVPVIVLDTASFIQQHQLPKLDGTLAYTAFSGRLLELDFIHHRVRISKVKHAVPECTPASCDTFSLINFNPSGPPVVVAQGFEVNGHRVSAQIDTMYTGSVLIYSGAIQKAELEGKAKTGRQRDFPFTDGGVKMKEADAVSETFHNLEFSPRTVYFPTPGVHEPDKRFDATVGLEALNNTVLTLDFQTARIWVER